MEKKLTYRDYAHYANLSSAELARQCEVEAFRATGPGGQGVNTTDSAVRNTSNAGVFGRRCTKTSYRWEISGTVHKNGLSRGHLGDRYQCLNFLIHNNGNNR